MVVVEYCVWLWVWSISTSVWKRNGIFCFATVWHFVELGVRTYSPDDANKKPQLLAEGLVLLEKCGAHVGIIRGYAAHPVGVAVALLWRCLALGARLELGVRTYSPDDANKKPQLKSWGLIFGAPGGIRTPDQVVRSHLLYPAELRVLEVVLSVT